MLNNAIEAERAERDQEADCARIDAAIVVSEQDITALEDQQLDQLEMQKRWSAIRDRTILAIRDVVHNVSKRADEAKASASRFQFLGGSARQSMPLTRLQADRNTCANVVTSAYATTRFHCAMPSHECPATAFRRAVAARNQVGRLPVHRPQGRQPGEALQPSRQ